jgi:hypothetical protein
VKLRKYGKLKVTKDEFMKNYAAIVVKNRKELERYAEQWVALSPKTRKIIASGKTPKQALLEAQKKGESDPILTRVPKRFHAYIV